jgi:WD40 repeat protein
MVASESETKGRRSKYTKAAETTPKKRETTPKKRDNDELKKSPVASSNKKSPASSSKKQKKEMTTPTPKKRDNNKEEELAMKSPLVVASSKKSPKESSSKKKKKQKKNETPQKEQEEEDTATPMEISTPQRAALPETNETTTTTGVEKEEATLAKIPPTLQVSAHRLRDLDYLPGEIVALASSACGDFCAVSRTNGTVELKSAKEMFWTVAQVAGSPHVQASVLEWVGGTSLIAGGPDGSLWMVDFESSQLVSRIPSGGGGVFGLAALKGSSCFGNNIVAAACQDGSVRLYQVFAKAKRLEPLATLPSAGAALLSLAWGLVTTTNVAQSDGSSTQQQLLDTVIFCGAADGTIRRYSVQLRASGGTDNSDGEANADESDITFSLHTVKSTLRMTMESKGRRTPTKVWALKLLQDGTLISGNSLGNVQFWDSATGTLLQSIQQNELKADVLGLAVSAEENKVFASGVDSRVICLERQRRITTTTISTGQGGSAAPAPIMPWILTNAQRPHTHDVKALVICKDSNAQDVLVTGGVDTKMCTYLVQEFSKKRPRNLYPWPSFSPVTSVAKEARILVMQRNHQVDLYGLTSLVVENEPQESPRSSMVATADGSSRLLGSVKVESNSNLVASSISTDGTLLAICDASALFVFALDCQRQESSDENGAIVSVIPRRLTLSSELATTPFLSLNFIRHDQLLAADCNGKVHVLKIQNEEIVNHSILSMPAALSSSMSSSQEWPRLPIRSTHTSPNGEWIATLSHCQQEAVHVFRANSAGSYQHVWSLPSLGARPSAITFVPASTGGSSAPPQLAVATASSAVYVFDIPSKSLNKWSETRGFPITEMPYELANRREYPIRLSVNPAAPEKLIIVSVQVPTHYCLMKVNRRDRYYNTLYFLRLQY